MIARRAGAAIGALLALLLLAGGAGAQVARFSVRPGGAAEGWRPVVRAEGLLADPALRGALDSGLPLRLRLRVELWERRVPDRLSDVHEIGLVLVQDPLDGDYVLETRRIERRFGTLAQVQEAVDRALRPELRPSGSGRFYYLATLEVETLSLSDLEELRRWLRGDVASAIGGDRAPERAVGTGMRRLLIRVLGLPTRSFEARSETFRLR